MKAMDISPAVMSAMGSPRMQRGMSAFSSIYSRMPAIITIASM